MGFENHLYKKRTRQKVKFIFAHVTELIGQDFTVFFLKKKLGCEVGVNYLFNAYSQQF